MFFCSWEQTVVLLRSGEVDHNVLLLITFRVRNKLRKSIKIVIVMSYVAQMDYDKAIACGSTFDKNKWRVEIPLSESF